MPAASVILLGVVGGQRREPGAPGEAGAGLQGVGDRLRLGICEGWWVGTRRDKENTQH